MYPVAQTQVLEPLVNSAEVVLTPRPVHGEQGALPEALKKPALQTQARTPPFPPRCCPPPL